MDSAPIPMDMLLAHREWVRAVARAVVRDPNAADDVEQETWLAALRSPPRDASSLRGWFGAVTRSRARRIGRTDRRRETREAVVARPERTPSAGHLAELADTHRRVVAAVVELDEPYRETILLRYFEGLSIDEVAARTAAPVETVRSRVKRGVAKLRERLEREFGTRERPWHLALVPLIDGTRGNTAAGVGAAMGGGIVMAGTTKTAVTIAAVVLLLGAGAVMVPKWMPGDAHEVAALPDDPAPRKPAPPAPRETTPPVQTPRARSVAQEAPPAPAPAPEEKAPAAPTETVQQRLDKVKLTVSWTETKLLDVYGELAARSGVEIVISAEAVESWAHDDALDRLCLDQKVRATQILDLVSALKGMKWVVEEPRVVIVPAIPVGGTRDKSKPVIVPPPWKPRPGITVVGRVTNAMGAAVPGAEIVRISDVGEHVVATADIAGRYEARIPKPFGSIEAQAPGQQPSFAVLVQGQIDEQVTIDLATRGEAGTVVVKLITDVRPFPVVSVTVGRDAYATLPDGRKAFQRARRASSEEHSELTFTGVAPGQVPVFVSSEYDAEVPTVDVVAGKTSEVSIRLVAKPPVVETLASKRVSLDFRGARAAEVVAFLNDAFKLSIVIDPALAKAHEQGTITMTVKDRPLDETLRELCRQMGDVKYVVQGPVVYITAAKR